MPQLLVVNPDTEEAAELATSLSPTYEVEVTGTLHGAVERFRRGRPDAAIVCDELPDGSVFELIERASLEAPGTMVLVIGSRDSAAEAVRAMKAGASDYLPKPIDAAELELKVSRSLASRSMASHLDYLRSREARGARIEGLVGDCEAMREIFATVLRLGRKTTRKASPSVLITGETGTGKGVVARALHFSSQRQDGPFVEVNCASIPDNLLEVEVFGAERGAYTGAHAVRIGFVETAENGTLFLDEIGCLSLPMQAKLLTFLESHKYRRVGSSVERHADIQVVVATNIDLHAAVARGEFREDLLHRLQVIVLPIPPLRARGADRMKLAEHLCAQICAEYGMPPRVFADDVRALVERYSWPGNVRELRNAIEQILLLEDSQVIRAEHFPIRANRATGHLKGDQHGISIDMPPEGLPLFAVEEALIEQTLRVCNGNVSRSARLLQISRDQLRYWLAKRGA